MLFFHYMDTLFARFVALKGNYTAPPNCPRRAALVHFMNMRQAGAAPITIAEPRPKATDKRWTDE
jgi:hypothetical protein